MPCIIWATELVQINENAYVKLADVKGLSEVQHPSYVIVCSNGERYAIDDKLTGPAMDKGVPIL